jgi:hypothetical protein
VFRVQNLVSPGLLSLSGPAVDNAALPQGTLDSNGFEFGFFFGCSFKGPGPDGDQTIGKLDPTGDPKFLTSTAASFANHRVLLVFGCWLLYQGAGWP